MVFEHWRKLKVFKSLQNQILFVFLILILPSSIMLIYYNFYAIEVIRNQVAHSNENLLNLYMGTIDKELEDVDKYLNNLIAQEPDLLALDLPEQSNSDVYNLARIRLYNRLSNDIVYYDKIDMFFIFSNTNGDLVSAPTQQMAYLERIRLKSEIQSLFDQQQNPTHPQWFLYQEKATPSLYRLIRYGNVYIGAMININQLMLPFESTDLGQEGAVLMVNEQYQPVIFDPTINKEGIEFLPTLNGYSRVGSHNQYMTVSKKSRKGNFTVFAMIHERQIMENIPYLRRIVAMIVVATIIVLPVVYLFLRLVVLVPMQRVVSAMRKIKSGNWEARIEPKDSSTEFSIINETFNTMVTQIKELKINIYEEQLNNQKTELKHLQLQINPHFFLNALNIIYHLAQIKNYVLIQEMSLSLVRYFRFMFQSNLSFVPVRDEIEHTRNYLKIQQLRFPETLTVTIMAEDQLMDSLVPPLVCQTFVENTIKHAVSMDSLMHITVKVYVDEGDPHYMWIDIRDTGKGFHPEILEKLLDGIDIGGDEGNHIGIWNIRRRLRLLYPKGGTWIHFANDINKGAVVRIHVPIINQETREVERDAPSASRR